jgi:hypothetical protein
MCSPQIIHQNTIATNRLLSIKFIISHYCYNFNFLTFYFKDMRYIMIQQVMEYLKNLESLSSFCLLYLQLKLNLLLAFFQVALILKFYI